MNWWQAMVTILLGNMIVLIPMVLNAHAGTKYGISFPVLCRASFGVRGANVAAMLRAIVACGWFGIQTWIGALALDALFDRGVAAAGRRSRSASCDRVRDLLGHPGRHHPQGHRRHQGSRELVGAAAARRRRCCFSCGRIENGGGLGHVLAESQKLQTGTDAVLDALSRRAHGERRLLGDAQSQHPRLHALREEPAVAGARPGARPADDDDGVRVHRRRGDERDDRHLRQGDLGSGRARHARSAAPA